MSAENNYEELLEEVCKKLDNIENVKEIDILEIKNSVESIENLITDTQAKLNFQDIKEKLEKVAFQVDNCNDALLKDLYNDLNSLKETTNSVSQHLENLQNIQNLALTSGEFEEFQKQQLDLALKTNENIFNELKTLNEHSKTIANPENVKNIAVQIDNLHKTLSQYIEQVVGKIEAVPNIEEIGSVISDLNSVEQKSIKKTNSLIKDLETKLGEFKSEFDNKDFEQQITKISEIYDSLNMINAWIEKVGYINQSIENVYARLGENIDFDDVSEKIDIIYDNITTLNNWTMKIDKFDDSMSEIHSKISELNNFMNDTQNISKTIDTIKERFDSSLTEKFDFDDMTNKMDIVYDNLSAINQWANKVDNLSEKVDDVSGKFDNVSDKIEDLSGSIQQINNIIDEETITTKFDVIYENISLLNEWVNKIDNLTQKSEELDIKYSETNDNLNIKIDEITETLSRAVRIVEDVPNLKDKLEELSGELHAVTSTTKADAGSYFYSLLDIESDFLKLHQFLDDNTKTTSEDINALKERFSELNDDISSISIRTNKLILSADDANKEFKETLETFKTSIQELDEQRQKFNPELQFALLDDKVNQIANLMQNTTETAKNLNNAFIYLADWVDATGNILNAMQTDVSAVKEDNSAMIELKLLAGDISDVLNKTSELEKSFEKYKKNDIPIINDAVSYLINKIDEINEKLNTDCAKNFENIETQLMPINDNILSANANLNTVKEEIAEINEEVEAVKGGMAILGEGMDTIINDFDKFNSVIEIPEIKNNISDLKNTIDKVEVIFDNFKTDDISEIKSSLTGIMVQLNTAIMPDIDSLNERIDKLAEDNQQHISKIEEIVEEKFSKQEQKIISLEEKIENLNSKFDKLIESMNEDNHNSEIKDILNYLVTQLAATNDSITTNQQGAFKVLQQVADKVSDFDKIATANENISANQQSAFKVLKQVAGKVSSFDENINKIVSYIEED